MVKNENEKLLLLEELAKLGRHPSGRKIRTDKEQIRGPNSHIRSDAGQYRINTIGLQKEPVSVYSRLRTILLEKEATSEDNKLQEDINGIFIVIDRPNIVKMGNYSITSKGVAINRTVKRIQQVTIDLEQLRFVALQELAGNSWDFSKYSKLFKHEIEITQATDYVDLFCGLYHLLPEEYIRWTYKQWRQDYMIVCDKYLDKDFKFRVNQRPGTNEFLPEYVSNRKEVENKLIQEITYSKEYVNELAKIRDTIIAELIKPIRNELLNDNNHSGMSLSQINKLALRQVDEKIVNDRVSAYMANWVKTKLVK